MTEESKKNNDYQSKFDEAYRAGVGMVIFNKKGEVFVAERIDSKNSWQFPQGGIDEGEEPKDTVFREMEEEIGTRNAKIIGMMDEWTYYDFPPHVAKKMGTQLRGQRHQWVALRFLGNDDDIKLDTYIEPEFSRWKWVPIEDLLKEIVMFKRDAYTKIIEKFKHLAKEV